MRTISVVTGEIFENSYIVFDEEARQGVVLDPGDDAEKIMAQIDQNGIAITHILLTHGHWDHIGAIDALRERYGAKVAIHEADAEMLTSERKNLSFLRGIPLTLGSADILFKDKDAIDVGNTHITVLHTPGHSPGSVCYIADNAMFSGDTLFENSIGRTDLPGGSMEQMRASLGRLKTIEEDYEVYPGHGGATTLSEEKAMNPYMGW